MSGGAWPSNKKVDVPEGLWMRCPKCEAMVYRKAMEEALHVCPECQHHYRVDARTRVAQLADPETFEEFLANLVPTDPLHFVDRIPYPERIKQTQDKSGQKEAIIVGKAHIRGRPVILGVMDSSFIMASMGSVVGEKVTAATERAMEEKLPLVIVTASGGARMQEGMISLVQMARTSATIGRFSDAGGLYVTVMSDPTTAGVAASFAFLGDVIVAEPGAMVGFAGPRVIANTIRRNCPKASRPPSSCSSTASSTASSIARTSAARSQESWTTAQMRRPGIGQRTPDN